MAGACTVQQCANNARAPPRAEARGDWLRVDAAAAPGEPAAAVRTRYHVDGGGGGGGGGGALRTAACWARAVTVREPQHFQYLLARRFGGLTLVSRAPWLLVTGAPGLFSWPNTLWTT
eukprot:COSAG05_NODE_4385_length_1535_cov_80.805710_2_plen_117_part_01